MRAAQVDRRLEAVAGPILYDVHEPAIITGVPGPATMICVGRWVPNESTQFLAHLTATVYQQVNAGGAWAGNTSAARGITENGIYWVALQAVTPVNPCALLQRRIAEYQPWAGVGRGIILPGQNRSAAQLRQIAYAMIPTI